MESDPWFLAPAASGPAHSPAGWQLFCLPYAGGGASAFRAMARAMPAHVRLEAVQLPGRETRIIELPGVDIAAVTDAICRRAAGRYALYGHSMGARLGFEVVRELVRRGARLPERLYVAAARPPEVDDPLRHLARLPEPEFLDRVRALGGTAPGVFDHPDLRALVLPALRADFTWLDGYRYEPGPPLPVPIVALAGAGDPSVPVEPLPGWARHTTAGFRLCTVAGGHFFLTESAGPLADTVARDLSGDPRAPLAPPGPDEVHLFGGPPDREALVRAAARRYGVERGAAGLHLTVTGTPGCALATVAPAGGLAADLVTEDRDPAALRATALCAAELAELAGLPAAEQNPMVLRYWTGKRALARATGEPGLGPRRLDLSGQANGVPWRARPTGEAVGATAAGHRVLHLRLPPGCLCALAVPGPGWRLRYETLSEATP